MTFFNYHATAKRLIKENKLKAFYFTDNHNGISPALVLLFDDISHPVMPIRKDRFFEYIDLLPPDKRIKNADF